MTGTNITYDFIQAAYKQYGYPFEEVRYKPNYFGFRSKENTVDMFNDLIGVSYLDAFSNKQCLIFKGTTKPGLRYLKDELGNPKGTFILQPGFHERCWGPGLHNGKSPAMVQFKPGVFRGWRDLDKDGQLDYTGQIYTDASGVNGHSTKNDINVERVGAFSAGCQVIQDDKEHAIWYNVGARAWEFEKKAFSYALFQEK
jgi:hypothetical protein